ncbi:peptide-methionine (R)-S-oxide reductase MsrB [Gracilimonas amylolytica]|uniref:peptide-methionine (R)-S-oxide reductase MsrB n=1 Tax=Gracilimonas amylolytica TaxID=1749045 RepID=UPI000CD92C42|nr:peptide-methionine (R)-S-oxide reductase MsrB [Gracilimonas amylolytica]
MLTWKDLKEFAKSGNPVPECRVEKSAEEWKKELTDEQYAITRLKGTERPGSSDMCFKFDPGIYSCVCCGTELFDAGEKFESGSGWPSFTQPIKEDAVKYEMDTSHGMVRIEALCNVCDAHLGHVFPDGPEPSGLRYCMNAVSLEKTEDA